MIKTIIDMRNSLEESLKDKELLDVYFLIENKNYNVAIVVKTDKVLYIDPDEFQYNFTDKFSALEKVIKIILDIKPNFRYFSIWCIDYKDLQELKKENILECVKLPAEVECDKKIYEAPITKYAYSRVLRLITESKDKIKKD